MKNYKVLIITLLLQVSISVADAALVQLPTGKLAQTVSGQTFNFDFNGVPLSDGTDGELILRARGDYTPAIAGFDESIGLNIDGASLGSLRMDDANSNVLNNFGPNDNEWEQTVLLPGFFLENFWTSDGVINLVINLGSDVSLDFNPAEAYVDVTLKYSTDAVVPEPPVFFLLLTGLLLLLGKNRKSTQTP